MIYLSSRPGRADVVTGTRRRGNPLAAPVTVDVGALLRRPDIGVMLTPASKGDVLGAARRSSWWAADTGCFTRPEAYSDVGYLSWLEVLAPARATCLFATAPDVVGDWQATWQRAAPVLPAIRGLGFLASVVAQDGMVMLPPLEMWDVLFVGGTTRWKLSESGGYRMARMALEQGKRLHLGRVNSWVRIRAAAQAGYHSSDGSALSYNPPMMAAEIVGWLDRLQRQPHLALWD